MFDKLFDIFSCSEEDTIGPAPELKFEKVGTTKSVEKSEIRPSIGKEHGEEYGVIDKINKKFGVEILKNIVTSLKPDDLTHEVKDTLNILTINDITEKSKTTSTAGSYKWKAQKYPGDIDMLEFYNITANSKDEAIQKVVEGIAQVAKDIQENRNVILADFKCGFDPRYIDFVKNLGQLKGSYVLPDMVAHFEKDILGYNKQTCESELAKMSEQGAIDDATKNKVLSLLPQSGKMTGDAYASILKAIRPFYLLRWSVNDLLNKAKIIPSKKPGKSSFVVDLGVAVQHDTVCKLDLWAKVGGRWTEITNIFIFTYRDINNQKTPIGFYFKNTVDEATEVDIIFYSLPDHEKPFKLSKRIWNRAILIVSRSADANGNIDYSKVDFTQLYILKKIFPLFSSDISSIGQMVADIELAVMAMEKKEQLTLTYDLIFKDIFGLVESIPQKLFRIVLVNNQQSEEIKNKVFNILKYIKDKTGSDYTHVYNEKWDEFYKNGYAKQLIDMLEDLQDTMSGLQNGYAKQYLIHTKLHPRVENTLVQAKYEHNYLNLKKDDIFKDDVTNQSGGQVGSNDPYYRKYLKYKAKYLGLRS